MRDSLEKLKAYYATSGVALWMLLACNIVIAVIAIAVEVADQPDWPSRLIALLELFF